jgi:hypothetical protein
MENKKKNLDMRITTINKRGTGEILTNNLIYIILFLVFFMLMFYFVVGFQDGSSVWEEFYAKEIVKIVNEAEPGTEIYLDVTALTKIAFKHGKSRNEIITFNNLQNLVIVSLTSKRGTSFNFFNDVDIVEPSIKLISGGKETNRLYFKVMERQRDENE